MATLRLLLTVAGLVSAASDVSWQSLQEGLTAWEAFGFDTSFSYSVTRDNRSLFQYPASHDPTTLAWSDGAVQIFIAGAKSDLLRNVTVPVVMAIFKGKDPSLTTGEKSVSRDELLEEGGGVTLPALLAARGVSPQHPQPGWPLIQRALDLWAAMGWDKSFTFNVGTRNGTVFTYTKGTTDMNRRLPGASLSKWPATLTIAGLVADGTMSFDDKANKYLDWWSKDPSDPRSNITLRHLLTFQSGYTSDPRVLCQYNPFANFLKCAETLYKSAKISSPPGKTWSYISIHLQLAAAMAVSASGLAPDVIFQRYVYQPLGMNGTSWFPKKNPMMAAGIVTTGADFEKMLNKMLSYEFLGQKVLSEMEEDWSAPVSPCGDGWFGHYGMGHWFDCMGYGSGQAKGSSAQLSQWCADEKIQAGPGAFGFFPLIDRKRGYYMQIVLKEDSKCRSEIPEYLRILAKPLVDAILEKRSATERELFEGRGALILREVYDIYKSLPPRCWPLGEQIQI